MQLLSESEISEQKKYLKGVELFNGQWPSFHDAEIYSFNISRSTSDVIAGSVIIEMTVKVFHSLTKCGLIDFRFYGCAGIAVNNFNQQNELQTIRIGIVKQITNPEKGVWPRDTVVIYLGNNQVDVPENVLTVKLIPEFGIESEFKCLNGEIVQFKEINC